jgi:hypothetical protein
MATSYCHLATHIIFSTDKRNYHFNDTKQIEMHTYIA